MARRLVIVIAAAGFVVTAPAAGEVVRCDGPGRAGPTGTPELMTDCGRLDASLGSGELARRALDRLAPSLGVDPSEFEVADATRSPAGRTLRLQQAVRGIPVFNGQIVLGFSDGGALRWVRSSAIARAPLSLRPRVSVTEALSAAGRATGGGELRLAPTTDLVVYPTSDASVLAWHVVLPTSAPADWNVIVDAATGRVIATWNAIQENNSASIFDPSPIQTAGTYTGFADGNDADSAKLTANRITGFPLTHLNPSVNTLKGDFADLTGPGITGSTLPYTPGLAHSATRDYNYKRSNDRFEEASVYSSLTRTQSLIQNLGFTDANNRSIPVDVHYYSIRQLVLLEHRPRASLRRRRGRRRRGRRHRPARVRALGAGQPGAQVTARASTPSSGQWARASATSSPGCTTSTTASRAYLSTRRYCIGDWDAVSYNPFSGAGNGSGCLRWIDGTNEGTGADIGQYSGTPSQEHNDGRFWSAAMTCIFEGLGGNVAARNRVLKLVLAHNAMLVPTASNNAFEDSVAALRVADQNLFGGANRQLINRCARQRGLIE